jgi:hypothetical protein
MGKMQYLSYPFSESFLQCILLTSSILVKIHYLSTLLTILVSTGFNTRYFKGSVIFSTCGYLDGKWVIKLL